MFHSSMFRQTTSKKPRQNPTIFSRLFGNGRSAISRKVNENTAMQLSAFRACVTIIAESISQMPCCVYERTDKHKKQDLSHPLADLLMYCPNEKDTAQEYFEFSLGHMLVGGDAFTWVDRDKSASIVNLNPIHPQNVTVMKAPNGAPFYRLLDAQETVSARLIHHTKCFSTNGYTGLSPIQASPDVLGLGLATEDHAAGIFDKGMTSSGVITAEKSPFETQESIDNFLEKFISRHTGDNAMSVALLKDGLKYQELAVHADKSQLLESRRFTVEQICRLFRVPRHMIQDDSKTSFNTVEQLSINFVIYTLMPWIKRLEASMMRDLLLKSERRARFIEFDVSHLLKGDLASRYDAYGKGRQWGWLSANDVRRLENLPPLGPKGDIYLSPVNMQNASQTEKLEKPSKQSVEEVKTICDL